jgi:hypothetical protein
MAKPPTSPEFDRFTAVVDQVLSVPKPQAGPWSEEKKDRILCEVKKDLEAEERRKSQVVPKQSS